MREGVGAFHRLRAEGYGHAGTPRPSRDDGGSEAMSQKREKAVLAGGCFWGMQDLIRRRPGILSTRVGYTGGDVANATYRNHGTHAEAIEIIFDPEVTSYRELLEFTSAGPFWEAEPEHQDYLERYPNGYTCHFPRPGWVLPHRSAAAR
jgi:peptide-methionine (S)-S-oxide reductase